MHPPRESRLFLTGFMGCGKSTVAPVLAGLLGFDCLDIDDAVERKAGSTISGIFADRGEKAFREMEREALLGTMGMSRLVVALGGGTVADETNFAFIRSTGLLIYLRADFETLVARLSAKEDRPLIQRRTLPGLPPGDALRDAMQRLLAERGRWYERADVIVTPDPHDAGRTAAGIAAALARLRAGSVT